MALYPFFDSRSFIRPLSGLDQHSGLVLDPDDLFDFLIFSPRSLRDSAGYLRSWRTESSERNTSSAVNLDRYKFQANLEVQQFKPEEISIELIEDKTITVDAKHEEKQDEHEYISRHFIRRYVLPENCDISKIQSRLSSDGVLTITAPRVDADQANYKEIPIQQTGEPAKRVKGQIESTVENEQ